MVTNIKFYNLLKFQKIKFNVLNNYLYHTVAFVSMFLIFVRSRPTTSK